MFNIDKFLEKFSKNISSLELNNLKIIDIINKHTGVLLKKDDIEIKNYTIFIKKSPAIKNKLFINKQKIIDDILKITKESIVDIR